MSRQVSFGPTVYLMIFSVSFLLSACGDQDRIIRSESNQTAMPIQIALGKVAAAQVDRVELIITADDMTTVQQPLEISDGVVQGTIVVPVGPRRLFTINAYDSAGDLIYQGSATADVLPEGQTVVPSISVRAINRETSYPLTKSLKFPGDYGVEYVGNEEVEFVAIPAGPFTMGSDVGESDNQPSHVVYMPVYYIGKYEITVEQFLELVRKHFPVKYPSDRYYRKNGEFIEPHDPVYQYGGFGDSNEGWQFVMVNDTIDVDPAYRSQATHPVRMVDYYGAKWFCESLGARLPTNAEWEKAARGVDGRRFVWGDRYVPGASHNSVEAQQIVPAEVGTSTEDVSVFGVHDMAGNVSEWVSDFHEDYYYYRGETENPQGPVIPNDWSATVRGGNYGTPTMHPLTTYYRSSRHIAGREGSIGFRCATDR
jgi:formylglycine-generating enzyme required for sulfatase activity